MSWEFDTTPIPVDGYKPTSHIVLNSMKVDAEKLKSIESIIYGSDTEEPRLPLPDEIISLLKNA